MKPIEEKEFLRLASIARLEAGLNFPAGKRSFVAARLQRRLRAIGIGDFASYLSLIEGEGSASEQERIELVSALTTNVTGIFRESHHFEHLAAMLLGARDDRTRKKWPFRIWSAGCSSGEEALSIAATCSAVLGPDWAKYARILATDIDARILNIALNRPEDLTVERRLRDGLRAVGNLPFPAPEVGISALRAGITFMRQNLLQRLPIAHPFDAIFCRNVTIYFTQDMQERVHRHLQDCLAVDGLLVIGHSERLSFPDADIRLIGATTYLRNDSTGPGCTAWH